MRKIYAGIIVLFIIAAMIVPVSSASLPEGFVDPMTIVKGQNSVEYDFMYGGPSPVTELYVVPKETIGLQAWIDAVDYLWIEDQVNYLMPAVNAKPFIINANPQDLEVTYKSEVKASPTGYVYVDNQIDSVNGEAVFKIDNLEYYIDGSNPKILFRDFSGKLTVNYNPQVYPSETHLYGDKGDVSFINIDNTVCIDILLDEKVVTSNTFDFLELKVLGVKFGSAVSSHVSETNTASENSGEEGYGVPAAIVTGAVAAAAAAAGAGLGGFGGGGSEGANENNNRRSSYRMYVRKDFGNKIRYNKPVETVYARMAEIKPDGTEIDRPDLTSQITISSAGNPITVEGASMSGNYMGALVSAEGKETPDRAKTGTVSFLFIGEGGSFENNLTFDLVGDPYVKFTEQGSMMTMTLSMLYGDNGDYETEVELVDFVKVPESIRVEPQENSPFTVETTPVSKTKYKILLHNTSTIPEKPSAKKEFFTLKVIAENETEKADDTLKIDMLPEGLSVHSIDFDDEGHAIVPACDDKDTEAKDTITTRFAINLAVKVNEGGKVRAKIIEPTLYKPQFASMKGTDNETNVLVSKFKCEIDDGGNNGFRFAPKQQLPEAEKPYYVIQPISADYEGKTYTLDLPVRLIGEKIEPKADWEKEFELLKRRVKKFGINQEAANFIRANGKKLSVDELRLLSKKIIYDSIKYYTKEGEEFLATAQTFDNLIDLFSVLKWMGDQAFSYLATLYTGPVGDAILTPAKDLTVEFLGECSAMIFMGKEIDFNEIKVGAHISEMLEQAIVESINFEKVNASNIKKIGATVAGLCVYNLIRHYIFDKDENGNRNFYKAILSSFGDISNTACRKVFTSMFEKGMKDPNSRISKLASNSCAKWIRKMLPPTTIANAKSSSVLSQYLKDNATVAGAIEKGLENFLGAGAATVMSSIAEKEVDNTYKLVVAMGTDENGVNYTAYINLFIAFDNLTAFMFKSVYEEFPFPTAEKGEECTRLKDSLYMDLKTNTRIG